MNDDIIVTNFDLMSTLFWSFVIDYLIYLGTCNAALYNYLTA